MNKKKTHFHAAEEVYASKALSVLGLIVDKIALVICLLCVSFPEGEVNGHKEGAARRGRVCYC